MSLKLNGQEIPEAAIEHEYKRLVKFYAQHMSAEEVRKQSGLLKEKAKEQALGAKLLMDEANRLDVRVSAEDVDRRHEEIVRDAGGAAAFQDLLRKQGMTDAMIRRTIEQGQRVDKLIEKIVAGVEDPTEAAMRAHFEAHREEYRIGDRVQAQHILIRPASGGEADRGVAQSRLMEIRHRIEEGGDFADEAAAHSDCPSGRKSGGSLGWLSRGTMIPAIDQALFSMASGAVSEVVETPLGFHVFRKTAEEASRLALFEEVRENIRDFLRHVYRGQAIGAYVEDLRNKAVIEED